MPPVDAPPPDLLAFLGRLDSRGLAELLQLRPDVLWHPAPRDLADLADRLAEPEGVAEVLRTLPLPAPQLAEALSALGGSAPLAELAALLGVAPTDAGLLTTVGILQQRAVLWVDGDDDDAARVAAAPGVLGVFPSPLGLHLPLARLLPHRTAAQMHAQLRALGEPLPASKSRAAAESALAAVLLDPDRVRAVAATAPPSVHEWMRSRFGDRSGQVTEHGYRPPHPAERWVLEHGLGVPPLWGQEAVLPREVAMLLRPRGATAPFAGSLPPVTTRPVPESAVASASAAAVTELLATTTALLDDVARTPVSLLRSGDGGVGARELKRLGRAVGAPPEQVRMALELSHAIGLLDDGEGYAEVLTVSPLGVRWRADDPVERALSLMAAWLDLDRVPTASQTDGRVRPALVHAWHDAEGGLQLARESLLELLAGLPADAATSADGVRARARWASPSASGDLGHHWREAELVGLVGGGAISPVGRAVLEGDRDAAVAALAGVLPQTVDEVLLGADLTAVVPGDPSARVSALLDSCADREGRGGAVVWRFSPGSVRRALDTGTTSAMLLADLESVAAGALPQPLSYLVGDVARSHGRLRVRPAVSLVRCDDEPLLAQAVADRALRSLGLSLVTSTVASSTAEAAALVAAMRRAGYLPMPEGPDGVVDLGGHGGGPGGGSAGGSAAQERRRERDLRREEFEGISRMAAELGITVLDPRGRVVGGGAEAPGPEPLDVTAVAERILGATERSGEAAPAEAVGVQLEALAKGLSRPQVQLLAHALSHRTDVEIDYETQVGTRSTRRVSDLSLVGASLHGWCHSAQDVRMFRVDRIRAVRP